MDWNGTERFRVLRCIGRGGMGTVYEARDLERRQSVALKTVLHFDPASLYQFKQEFRALSGVVHPNLVRLHELVMAEGDHVFFTMELVRGGDFLRHVQRTGTAPRLDDSGVQSYAAKPAPSSAPMLVRERGHSTADVDRLLPALRQLVAGVLALHDAGKLHRDIKPSNVLVTTEGRVVLLDFGVATNLRRVTGETADPKQVVGTATYMAPEQAFDDAPTTAADWYSVGVMLYEALVGVPPFIGSAIDVIQRKNEVDPRAPSEVVDGIPAELDALCRALLDRTPERRPTGPEILQRLGVGRAADGSRGEELRPVSLVGREAQVAELEDALQRVREGRPVTVRVTGRAGMGKSALVQSFLDRAAEQGEAVVLAGRAYERESLRYKAVDSAIDALSRYLVHLADHGDTLSFPADIRAFAHLFPVLRRVPVLDRVSEEPPGDPARTRRRAFGALRELLAKLARRRSLVLHIDDAQWGDTDSAALLLELVRPPNAPPILIVLAHREEDAATAPFLRELDARWPAGAAVRDVTVGPLDAEGTRRLALALIGPVGQLARVLEATPGAEPEAVANHLLGAGETERGGRFVVKAAERAATLLAFDQAARLYRLAIDTLGSAKAGALHVRLGEVLGWAGRHEQAGRAYLAAAEAAEPGARGPLDRAAAAQLIAAGRIDEGGVVLRRVLDGAGVEVPGSPEAIVASLVEAKTALQTLVLQFEERSADDVPAADRARIDALHVGAIGLASVDTVLSTSLQARQLVEALRAGDRARTVRAAVMYYGSHLASRGGPVSAHERDVHALIERLVERGGNAEELAFSRGTYGCGLYMRGRYGEAVEVIDAAYANLPSHQAGMQSQAAVYALYSLASLGQLVELRRRTTRLRADAEQRGDLFTQVMLSVSHPFVLKLADDDSEAARAAIREAKAQWSHSKYLLQDWQIMRSETEIELYVGDGAAAYDRLKRDEGPLEKSLLLGLQLLQIFTSYAAGRAAIASIDAAGSLRGERVAEAKARAVALRDEQIPWANAYAGLISASVKNAEGDREGTLLALREAIALADAADMMLHAASARHQLGLLLGGAEGALELQQAEDAMRAQDIRVPSRFAGLYLPGRWG